MAWYHLRGQLELVTQSIIAKKPWALRLAHGQGDLAPPGRARIAV
jgi:hypothetical protein